MPRAATGVFTRVANTFSNPVVGTVIDQDDADELFDDYDAGLFGYDVYLAGKAATVDLNAANTDTAITITLPTGITNYMIQAVVVKNKGTTASLTTATAGLFSAAAGAGLALAANQALSAIAAKDVNTDANALALTITVAARTWLDDTALFFRVGTAQGAAATADVYVYARPMP